MDKTCEECSYVRYMLDAITGEHELYCQLQDEEIEMEFVEDIVPE